MHAIDLLRNNPWNMQALIYAEQNEFKVLVQCIENRLGVQDASEQIRTFPTINEAREFAHVVLGF